MDLPLHGSNVRSTTPVGEVSFPANPSRDHHSRADAGEPANPWSASPERQRDDPVEEPILALDGDLATGLQASYRRYLQSLSWAEADVFNAAELLELLLYFGRSGDRATSLAVQLLERFGSLGGVLAADPAHLAQVLGKDVTSVTLLKAIRAALKAILREPLEDRPVISSASALMDYLSVTMRHEPTEAMRILFLDRKNALIKDEILHRGTVDHTPLYPREVVKRVLDLGACAIILVHNHPSGDPTPSQDDVEMTRQLAVALATIKVVLHDHVIVGRNRQVSLHKLKLI